MASNPFDQFDEPAQGAQAPTNKKQPNPFDQFDAAPETTPTPQAPNPNTPAEAAKPAETYGGGTGVIGAGVGVVKGVVNTPGKVADLASGAWDKLKSVGSDIKHQYETGTLTTPEFQQAGLLGKDYQLWKGAVTGLRETGQAIAQLPNTLINTSVALGHSIAPETITRDSSQNPVDIYGRDTFGSDNAVSQALQPETEQGQAIANALPYTMGGGFLREAANVHAMTVKQLQDQGIPLTSENIAQADTENMLLLGLGVGTKKAGGALYGGAAERGLLGGNAQARAMAGKFGEQAEDVYQGGNQAQQQAYKDVYTGQGNAGYKTAIDTAGGENAARAQQVLDTTINKTHDQIQATYKKHLGDAQSALDANNVKQLSMGKTKYAIADHLAADERTGMLEEKTKRVLSKMKERKFSNLAEVNDAKLDLSKLKSWAYRNGHYHDLDILNDVQGKLKTEADATVKQFAPDAVPAWQEADKLHSSLVDNFGKNSKAAKMAGNANAEQAENQLMGNTMTARGNVENLAGAYRGLRTNEGFVGGNELASTFAESVGNTARLRAHEMATEAARVAEQKVPGSGDAAYRKKFEDVLVNSDRQMRSIEGLTTQSQQGLNQAILDATNALKPTPIQPTTNLGRLFDAGVRQAPYVGKVYQAVEEPIRGGLRNMAEASKQRWLANATPEQIETMYQMSRSNTPAGAAMPYSAGIAAGQENPPQGATGAQNGMVTITLPPEEPEQAPEPEQHAQSYHAPQPEKTGLEKEGLKFFRAMAHAETGGIKGNRFIRTRQPEGAKPSSAWGSVQMTHDTMQDFYHQHRDLFNADEREYIGKFLEQGKAMLHSDPHHPVYGYGKEGTLGHSAADRKLYADVMQKVMIQKRKELGSWSKVAHWWRGNDKDTAYFKKVADHLRSQA